MLDSISVFKRGKPVLGADLHALQALSGISFGAYKYFLGKRPNLDDFKKDHKTLPVASPIFCVFVRYLFKHLDEFDGALLIPTAGPKDVRCKIDQLIETQETIYAGPLTNQQYAGLYGVNRTWALKQAKPDSLQALRGSSDAVSRISTVLLKGLTRWGTIALSEWCAIVEAEGRLRGQFDVLNKGWSKAESEDWHTKQMEKDLKSIRPKLVRNR